MVIACFAPVVITVTTLLECRVFEANIDDLLLGVRTLFLLLLGLLFVHAETTPVTEVLLGCAGTGHVRFYLTNRGGAKQLRIGARRFTLRQKLLHRHGWGFGLRFHYRLCRGSVFLPLPGTFDRNLGTCRVFLRVLSLLALVAEAVGTAAALGLLASSAGWVNIGWVNIGWVNIGWVNIGWENKVG